MSFGLAFLPYFLPSFLPFFHSWGLNSELCTCWQVFFHKSHASSPFCSGYFGDMVLLFAQAGLKP
jgi:hypothetical protein